MLESLILRQKIEKRFDEVKQKAQARSKQLFSVLDTCTEEEALCLKYLYAYMPEYDLASYEGELFLKFVRQALKVRKLVPWGEQIEDECFLQYVLQYRINNENVEYYRDLFFEELYPRIKDMNMYEAAIETNYWCFEKATYQSTDIRTASPLTVLKNTYGRCGEESTLATAALRSIGIPARQVYAPRWAHCDDNHAWTEVWIEAKWHFLGACEPEMKLDRGWFILPASKGMLVHTRAFSDFDQEEACVYQTEHLAEINVLEHYAQVKQLTVRVKDAEGKKVEGAKVRFELINYSELYPLAELEVNEMGEVSFTTGLGDLMLYAYKGNRHIAKKIDVRQVDFIELTLPEEEIEDKGVVDFTMIPAEGKVPEEEILTKELQDIHESKHAYALKVREAYKQTFYTGQKARQFAKDYAPFEKEVASILEKALGNYAELIAFFEDEDTVFLLEEKIKLLGTLRKKDFTDITCAILKDHLQASLVYKEDYEESIFVDYVLAPRIASEMIEAYKTPLLSRLTQEQKIDFKAHPQLMYSYIMENIKLGEQSNYSLVYTRPVGLFDLGVGSQASRQVLFVALCRALGIPAKYNHEDHTVAYYKEGRWKKLKGESQEPIQTGTLRLIKKDLEEMFEYHKHFTLAKFEDGVYKSLQYNHLIVKEQEVDVTLEVGHYRIITTNRGADGTLHVHMCYVKVEKDQVSTASLVMNREEVTKQAVLISDEEVQTFDHRVSKVSEWAQEHTPSIVAYLEVSGEPTEHLLNEILQSVKKYSTVKPPILFILKSEKDLEDPTLKKVLKALPHIQCVIRKDEINMDHLYDVFEIQDKKLPLAYTMQNPMEAKYAWAGYNVGVGELLLKYLV